MIWKEILKMPMNPNLRSERDERHKQAIIDYEKRVITPAFEEAVNSQPTLENRLLEVEILTSRYQDENQTRQGVYSIGSGTVERLGGNATFIIETIAQLYEQAGYQVRRHDAESFSFEQK